MILPSALVWLVLAGPPATPSPFKVQDAGRERVPDRWWETMAAMVRVSPRGKSAFPIKDSARLEVALDDLVTQGITAVEVFAPAEGGRSFEGLDTIDRYRLEPAAGTMDDFRKLVRLAHARSMAVISFDNLGYSSVEAVEFLKAADDVSRGRASREASFFVWSDSKDAPPPSAGSDRVFFVRPTHLPGATPGRSTNPRSTSIGNGASAPGSSTGPSGAARTGRATRSGCRSTTGGARPSRRRRRRSSASGWTRGSTGWSSTPSTGTSDAPGRCRGGG